MADSALCLPQKHLTHSALPSMTRTMLVATATSRSVVLKLYRPCSAHILSNTGGEQHQQRAPPATTEQGVALLLCLKFISLKTQGESTPPRPPRPPLSSSELPSCLARGHVSTPHSSDHSAEVHPPLSRAIVRRRPVALQDRRIEITLATSQRERSHHHTEICRWTECSPG